MALRRCFGCMNLVEEDICPHCGHPADHANERNHLPAGTVLRGQYLIGKVLGHGGFGITYIGWDLYLEMVVCIKEFYPASAVNRDVTQSLSVRVNTADAAVHYEQSRERFLREAQALAKLQHVPEIVSVQGFFTENNTAYIIMEYVRGIDLRHYVHQRGGKIPAREILGLMEPVVRALATVHQAGLVHRDISPDNIMLRYQGGAKLLDFGAVRAVDNMDADIDLSRSTEAILKHGFAPMEQYRSRGNMGPWTDEYGFCASVYYCITGKVPPDAPSRAIDDAQPDWDSVTGLTAGQLEALKKGMSMRAKDRFGSMQDLYAALYLNNTEHVQQEENAEESQVKHDPPKKNWAAIIAAAALAVVSLLAFLGREQISGLVMQLNQDPPAQTQPAAIQTEAPQTERPAIEFPSEEQTKPVETQPQVTETEPVQEVVVELSEPWVDNVMCNRPLSKLKAELANISSVTFVDNLADAPMNPNQIIDVSENGDGSVVAWGEWDNGYRVVIAAEGGINSGSNGCEGLFQGCANLQSVKFDTAFHSDNATSMDAMFAGCTLLNSIDLGALNTKNVRSMRYMFSLRDPSSRAFYSSEWTEENHWLTNLDLRSFETGNVVDMSYMFYGRQKMTQLLIDTWDVSSLQNMTKMFYQCALVEELGVGDWDVSQVTDMSNAFGYCRRLSRLDVSRWDVSSVNTMEGTFYYCNSMANLDVSNWSVSNVRTMKSMFSYCSILEYVDVSRWDVSNVSNMTDMFAHCLVLDEPEVDNWDISNVTAYNGFMDDGLINGKYWKWFFQDMGT